MIELPYIKGLTLFLLLSGISTPTFAGSEDVIVVNAWSRASIGILYQSKHGTTRLLR